ncbi:tetratricopeptide repeat protein [Pedobacter sp. SD-b]|uniref:Tetratricopeptide repeat protein n=1 Tax=Pedobacter segetis TaxID=2793069 RepID=A0ABS1BGE2_9SPHI|nr:tetratricopeptide repeat protein [Pedobacter segetis]MBK0381861.1 tetratricopeptide repeat protein [Pedobacter segetis]
MKRFLFFLLIINNLNTYAFQINGIKENEDSSAVNKINKASYQNRLTDPDQTILMAKRANKMALAIKFKEGEAESNRIIGIGYYYLNQRDSALNYYLLALNQFKFLKDDLGEAKVANNIGNLWIDIDYDKSLEYFKKTLQIAQKHNKKDLIAGSYLNIGNTFLRKKNYSVALKNYEKSSELFNEINNPIGITQSLQNRGVIYFKTNQFDKAEKLLLEANRKSKEHELNSAVSSINLSLSAIYIAENKFEDASKFLNEGMAFAKLVNDSKIIYDYIYTNYQLEYKRKNYEKALGYLKEINVLDSVNYNKNITSNINLIQQTLKQQQQQKENELTIQQQKNAKKLSIATGIVTILSFFVIFLLIKTNKKSKKSNLELKTLNDEVIRQKNNVDRINHRLEELIAERTKDLIIKNQKLSEYSSHLSHQIRGPVATLKGLMLLVEDDMVDSNEISPQIIKCVNKIDEQIMDINEALNDPTRYHLNRK